MPRTFRTAILYDYLINSGWERPYIIGHTLRDLCKTPPFVQFRRQGQILILEILHVCLRLKLSPFLILNKIERFSKVSVKRQQVVIMTGESRGVPDILPA
jgi:hypothetical protein